MGAAYIEDSPSFKELIEMILYDDDKILDRVYAVMETLIIKQNLHLKEEQHACIITSSENKLNAIVFFYEQCFEEKLTNLFTFLMEGIVCDWRNRKDYKYLNYLTEIGMLMRI